MSKLLHSSHFTSVHRRTISALAFTKSPYPFIPSLAHVPFRTCSFSLYQPLSPPNSLSTSLHRKNLSIRAFDSPSSEAKSDELPAETEKGKETVSSGTNTDSGTENGSLKSSDADYPSGEFEFKEFGPWKKFVVKVRMLFALPWQRVRKGSVLTMKLRGQVFAYLIHLE